MALPSLAEALRPWLPQMVAALLVLTALRVGPRAALAAADLGRTLGPVFMLQLAAPLVAAAALLAGGVLATPMGLAIVLALSAPSITGGPNMAIMFGHDPAPAMRLLVVGTALFPLTALPAILILPGVEPLAALRLTAVILGAVAIGFAIRAALIPEPSPEAVRRLDGLGVIALAVIVIGLMSAVTPALSGDPLRFATWLALSFLLCFGAQIAARPLGSAVALAAGNRNIALWLVALPPDTVAPLLIFIGCWQFPMYLTPTLMRGLHA